LEHPPDSSCQGMLVHRLIILVTLIPGHMKLHKLALVE
jgi:hypothetical protein